MQGQSVQVEGRDGEVDGAGAEVDSNVFGDVQSTCSFRVCLFSWLSYLRMCHDGPNGNPFKIKSRNLPISIRSTHCVTSFCKHSKHCDNQPSEVYQE